MTLLRDEAAPRGEGAGEPPRLVRAIAHGTRAQELLGQWGEEVCQAVGRCRVGAGGADKRNAEGRDVEHHRGRYLD